MAIKSFCNGCKHKGIDGKMKSLFNEVVQETFCVCPILSTDNISGCFTKNLEIDWEGFKVFCAEKGLLTEGTDDNRTES